jgi:S1-C subfamily serine protease
MVFSTKSKDDFFDNSLSPTIQITNENKKVTGTAVIFKSYPVENGLYINIALSCEHVMSNVVICQSFEYSERKFCINKINHYCASVYKNEQDDISILIFLSKSKFNTAKLEFNTKFDLLQNVYAVGCGLSESPRYTEGKINGLHKTNDFIENIRTNVPIVPGDSGCGLFTKDHKLVGISNHIKKLQLNGFSYPIEGISVFKPLELYKKKMDKNLFDELFQKNPDCQILQDYLWLLGAEYKI